jgi:tetratricopeptide (TPR) repeat protein
VRNEKDFYYVKEFFRSNLPVIKVENLNFFQRLYLFQSYVWYYFMLQDFIYYYRYSQKWVDLYHDHPEKQQDNLPLYIKGLHNLMNSHFLTGQLERLVTSLKELELIFEEKTLDKNTEGLLLLFRYIHHINKHYLEGTFTEGLELVPKLVELMEGNPYNWDNHRMMVFNYKIACLYFGSGDFDTTITYLNKIINRVNPNFREDIQCFSRILCLIAHYELGNDQLVEYQVKSVYRFLIRMKDMHKVQSEILRFIRNLTRILPSDVKTELRKLKDKLKKLEHDQFERRPFLYLDIISWIEGKLEGKTAEQKIREKFLAKQEV